MRRSNSHRLLFAVVLLVVAALLLGACRAEGGPVAGTTPAYGGPTAAVPTRAPATVAPPAGAAVPTRPPATVPPPAGAAVPTQPPATVPPSAVPIPGELPFSLAVLHSGEVYGEVLPCG